ncbi:hypothetical protein OKA05_22930 [Luteolibacter arcticus]|uniref:Serine/threonine protein kinase n=1 Tax=Luteolibacter arcticus TaxID=1581411 RepID=A0ABT3GPM3_9BACT|nr:hypothetical protein [Luteolibacter arcticus]MCW1925434.1 hypothetical protein [Luteolibacter arcticus]
MEVTQRYEIEDMLSQDDRGVAFRARDREEKRDVVLRRFFPNGREGGGLEPPEQQAFLEAVEKLKALKLKELRKTLDGGCDPVDGIPFLVTDWVEGDTLGSFTRGKPLESASVKDIVEVALKASQELSRVLEHETLWVGCSENSIVVPESGRGITFWVSPLASLNVRGLLPLAELAERLLGWKGKPIQHDSTGDGMAGWIRQIRANPKGWTLAAALEALQHPVSVTSATSTVQIQRAPGAATKQGAVATKPGAPPAKRAKKKKAVWPWVTVSLLLLLGGGGFAAWKTGSLEKVIAKFKGPEGKRHVTADEMRRELAAKSFPNSAQPPPAGWNAAGPTATNMPSSPPAAATAKADAAPKPGGTPAAAPAPRVPSGNQSVSGKILRAYDAKTGRGVRFLELEQSDKKTAMVGYRVAGGQPGLEVTDLNALKGKNARVTGEFAAEPPHPKVLFILSRGDIVEQP